MHFNLVVTNVDEVRSDLNVASQALLADESAGEHAFRSKDDVREENFSCTNKFIILAIVIVPHLKQEFLFYPMIIVD